MKGSSYLNRREMVSKATLRGHSIPVRLARMKRPRTPNIGRNEELWGILYTAGGDGNCKVILRDGLAIFY